MTPPTATKRNRKRSNKQKQWPPINKLTYTSGSIAWQVACMVNGKRIREAFETRATEIRTQVANEGRSTFSLDVQTRADAARVIEKFW